MNNKSDNEKRLLDIFHKYKGKLYVLISNELIEPTQEDIEDCIQEIFLGIIKNQDVFLGLKERNQKLYLLKTCKYVAWTHNKTSTMVNESGPKLCNNAEDAFESGVLASASVEEVGKMILEMEPTYADALYYRLIVGYSYAQIAQLLNISVNAARIRVSRGKRKLIKARGEEIRELFKNY